MKQCVRSSLCFGLVPHRKLGLENHQIHFIYPDVFPIFMNTSYICIHFFSFFSFVIYICGADVMGPDKMTKVQK